jgi:hypothetical protein
MFLLPLTDGIVHATAVLEIQRNSDVVRPTRHIPEPVFRRFVPDTVTTIMDAALACPVLGVTR